jgi:S-formylglutathione hydrolase
MGEITVRSEQRCHGGVMGFYSHASTSTGTEMKFAVYVPPNPDGAQLPVLYYLAGLTCTDETFMIKAGAQRLAAAAGIILVAPDTSPRGVELPGDREHWDFGVGAGFYVDATGCTAMSSTSCPRSSSRVSRPMAGAASSVTRWAGTARW